MIYCITQPLDKYVIDFGAVTVGPWTDMGKDPILFAMASFFTPLLYQWEQDSPVPLMARNVDVNADVTAQLMATTRIPLASGTTLKFILENSMSPPHVATRLEAQNFWDAPLTIYKTYTKEQLQMVFHARVLSWMRTHGHQDLAEWQKLYAEDEKFVKEHAHGSYKVR